MQGTLRNSQAASAKTAVDAARAVVTLPGVTAGSALSTAAASILVWGSLLAIVIEVAEDVRCDRYEKCMQDWQEEQRWCLTKVPRHKRKQCIDSVNDRLHLCLTNAPEPWPAPNTDPPWLVP